MTVEELIRDLSEYDPKATVLLEVYDVHDLNSVILNDESCVVLIAEDE